MAWGSRYFFAGSGGKCGEFGRGDLFCGFGMVWEWSSEGDFGIGERDGKFWWIEAISAVGEQDKRY